jgi:hypothetical protein
MKLRTTAFASMVLLVAPTAAQAEIDLSTPMLCAVTEAIECGYGAKCTYGPAEDVNIPPFIVVDPKAGMLREHKGIRKSTVQTVKQEDGQLLLNGYENRAYNISISQQTGRLSASAVGSDAGFVFFGICTNP